MLSEIIDISGEKDTNLNIKQVHQMTYLEQCVKETLRLFPLVPFLMRKVTKTFKLSMYVHTTIDTFLPLQVKNWR